MFHLLSKAAALEICGRRALNALLLLMVCSCSGPCAAPWQGETCEGSHPSFNSARIFLAPANEFSGFELELVQTKDGLRMYLNVYGLEIPPDPNDEATSRVFISFKDHSYTFSAVRFTGGQRLLIPEYVQSEIIEYLQEGQTVFIQVGRYQADIHPENFLDLFRKMVKVYL